MKIIAETVGGIHVAIDVIISDTVADVEAKIQAEEGSPQERQRLLVGRKELSSDRTIAECGITSGI